MRTLRSLTLSLAAFLAAPLAWADEARTLQVDLGTPLSLTAIVVNVINFMARSIGIVAAALVIIGALMIVISRGEDPMLSRGKDLIIYSLIGVAIVLGAAAILRMAFYIIYTT
jgi:nitrate reductase gamma subunit